MSPRAITPFPPKGGPGGWAAQGWGGRRSVPRCCEVCWVCGGLQGMSGRGGVSPPACSCGDALSIWDSPWGCWGRRCRSSSADVPVPSFRGAESAPIPVWPPRPFAAPLLRGRVGAWGRAARLTSLLPLPPMRSADKDSGRDDRAVCPQRSASVLWGTWRCPHPWAKGWHRAPLPRRGFAPSHPAVGFSQVVHRSRSISVGSWTAPAPRWQNQDVFSTQTGYGGAAAASSRKAEMGLGVEICPWLLLTGFSLLLGGCGGRSLSCREQGAALMPTSGAACSQHCRWGAGRGVGVPAPLESGSHLHPMAGYGSILSDPTAVVLSVLQTRRCCSPLRGTHPARGSWDGSEAGKGCRPATGSGSASCPAPCAAVCPLGTRAQRSVQVLPTAGTHGRADPAGRHPAKSSSYLTAAKPRGRWVLLARRGGSGCHPPPKHPPWRLGAAEAARWGGAVPVPRGSSPLARSALPALPNWFFPPLSLLRFPRCQHGGEPVCGAASRTAVGAPSRGAGRVWGLRCPPVSATPTRRNAASMARPSFPSLVVLRVTPNPSRPRSDVPSPWWQEAAEPRRRKLSLFIPSAATPLHSPLPQ